MSVAITLWKGFDGLELRIILLGGFNRLCVCWYYCLKWFSCVVASSLCTAIYLSQAEKLGHSHKAVSQVTSQSNQSVVEGSSNAAVEAVVTMGSFGFDVKCKLRYLVSHFSITAGMFVTLSCNGVRLQNEQSFSRVSAVKCIHPYDSIKFNTKSLVHQNKTSSIHSIVHGKTISSGIHCKSEDACTARSY